MNNIGTKNIETGRLLLRRLESNDYIDMYNNWCNDDEVTRYLPWDTHRSISDTKEILNIWINEYNNDHTYRWIVIEKNSNTPIGTIDVVSKDISNSVFELGHCYSKNYWHKGYASETMDAVINFLFKEVGVELIIAKHYENNIASGKVMQKIGMKYDGTLRDRIIDKVTKERTGLVYYSIKKEEYLNK